MLGSSLSKGGAALLTDFYQLTMGCAFWRAGLSEYEGAFHMFFRRNPFRGGFALASGLGTAIEFLKEFRFQKDDLEYLAAQRGEDGRPIFDPMFLNYLHSQKFACDVDAVPEGVPVFPQEPMIRVVGPVIQCLLLETVLLNILNFETLIATKAARICHAAGENAVLEFGLRRAQGADGGLSASRAAYIGGCSATSNVLAGKRYGIPVKGTQSHSWIMFFGDERVAFDTYADALPQQGVFLVDTYDSLEGIRHAIEVGSRLRDTGHKLIGLRLDSGDRVELSIRAREMLDRAGFPETVVVCSGDLDEYVITEMKAEGARVDVWGVGTMLVTGHPDAALGGVYKLGAVRAPGEPWSYRLKLSDEVAKGSTPGILQVRRFFGADGCFCLDVIYETEFGFSAEPPIGAVPSDSRDTEFCDLLVPIFRQGELVYPVPSIQASRERAKREIRRMPSSLLELTNPKPYPVHLDRSLARLRSELSAAAKQKIGGHLDESVDPCRSAK